jgi:hypothetical protein
MNAITSSNVLATPSASSSDARSNWAGVGRGEKKITAPAKAPPSRSRSTYLGPAARSPSQSMSTTSRSGVLSSKTSSAFSKESTSRTTAPWLISSEDHGDAPPRFWVTHSSRRPA